MQSHKSHEVSRSFITTKSHEVSFRLLVSPGELEGSRSNFTLPSTMSKIRKAIIKQFKDDFILEPNVPSTSNLESVTSVSRITSDDISRYSVSLTPSLRNIANRDELPTIPVLEVEPVDSSNCNEAVSPLQKRSLLQSFQRNTSLVSPNEPLPSIEGSPSREDQSKSLNLTPILGNPILANPMNEELSMVSLPNSSEKRTCFSDDSSFPSVDILPRTSSKQVLSESLQQNSFINKFFPSDSRRKEFGTESTLLANQWQESKEAHYDTSPKSSVDFSMPLNSSSTTNGNAVSSAPLARKIPGLSNSTSLSSSEADGGLMELKQSSVTQTSQQSRELPYNDSVIQTTTPTVINDKYDNDQNTLETKKCLDPTPITPPLPLTWSEKLNAFFKRENSVSGDFPLDGPSTSSSVQSPSVKSVTRTFPDGNPTSSEDEKAGVRVKARRKPSSTSLNPFILALAAFPEKPRIVSTEVREADSVEQKPFQSLQPAGESSDSTSANSPYALSPDDVLAGKMEELERIRRMESRSSSDVAELLTAAFVERQQELQTQVDKALAELRDVQEENKRLTNEIQSQHHSELQLKIEIYQLKHVPDDSSVQMENQLRDVLTSLTALNKEKRGWQDELDLMQHKLSVAERQVRCLDHLTRHKLDQPKRRGLLGVIGAMGALGEEIFQSCVHFAGRHMNIHSDRHKLPKRGELFASVPANMDIIGAMSALNEEVFQACIQLVEGLENTSTHSNRHKLQAQKLLGDHLTAMMEDQATMTKSGYNTLFMQAVLEVFMIHWCSSIIQASYPKQESFADLLVRLSARTSGSSAICGKQIRINQHSAPDKVKFNEWATDVIKELDSILMVAGVRMKTQRTQLFYTKTLALVKAAYDLRIAMTEQDIHGGLELVIVPPDTPFQGNWMLEAHADLRKGVMDQSYVEVVAGTTGIGLRRKVLDKVDGQFQSRMDVGLKPKVILTQVPKVRVAPQPSPTCSLTWIFSFYIIFHFIFITIQFFE